MPTEYFWEKLDAEVESICNADLEQLRDAGAILILEPLKGIGRLNEAVSFPLTLYEARVDLNELPEAMGAASHLRGSCITDREPGRGEDSSRYAR